jgi:hypothetical protein
MKKLIVVAVLLSSPAVAQDGVVKEPVCQPTGRTSKGDLFIRWSVATFPV